MMDTVSALLIIAGVINENNANWDLLGYDTYKFSALGTPDWDMVKRKAVDEIADQLAELKIRIDEAQP